MIAVQSSSLYYYIHSFLFYSYKPPVLAAAPDIPQMPHFSDKNPIKPRKILKKPPPALPYPLSFLTKNLRN